MKIHFVDLNKSLVKKVDDLFKEFKNNKWGLEFSTHCWDIFEYQKNNGGLIATASNPSFTMGWGLDAQIAMRFPEEVKNPREFNRTKNLIFTVTVDSYINASKSIVKRALIGCFAFAHKKDIIISWFGTAIWGLSSGDFLECMEYVLTADLSSANLRSANLRSADLSSADLRYADLRYANLRSANLRSANLSSANLRYANLRSADLRSANLRSANLSSAKNLELVLYNGSTAFFALQCPEEWEFIWWKKCKNNTIVKLLIPKNAKRSSATTRKCRASEAKVLAIYDSEWKEIKETFSSYSYNFLYKKWKVVKPKEEFCEDRWNECASGIHFFITRKEAELYN